jgi:hypothetical protein
MARVMSRPPKIDRDALVGESRGLISDLYSFGIRHQVRCERCREAERKADVVDCPTIRALQRLEDALTADIKRYR